MVIILTTVNSEDQSNMISKGLIDKKLAFCVKAIQNIKSTYYWKNKIVSDNEIIIIIKTFSNNIDKVKDYLLKKHNYETPEIILVKSKSLNDEYTKWANNQVDWIFKMPITYIM